MLLTMYEKNNYEKDVKDITMTRKSFNNICLDTYRENQENKK